MIELNDICFAYDSEAVLSHFNLKVNKGETVVIKGDNGCGKSTLLNIINALSFPQHGTYVFDGREVTERAMKNETFSKSLHQKIGYVFQNTDLQLFCARVEDEIAFGVNQMGMSADEVKNRVEDMIDLLDIDKLRGRAPYHLSMGEKKKVALASVLVTNPDVLVLDEPMNFLDKKSRQWIKDFLIKMKQIGKTVVIVSHTADFDDMADKIIEMQKKNEP